MSRLTLALVAALTATVLTLSARAERDDSASKKLGIELGMQCWTYNKVTTFEAMERCQKFGVKYLEMFPGQKMKPGAETKIGPGMSDAEIAELQDKAKSCGVKLESFGVSGLPADEAGLRKFFDWGKKVGIANLVTESYPNEVFDKLTKEYGIKVAVHNHPIRKNDANYKVWDPNFVLSIVKDKNPLIGACADTGHWIRSDLKPVDCLKILEGRVIESHFKDLNDKKQDVVYGTGIGDAKGMLVELKRQGFKGVLNIEYERGDLAHLDENIPLCVAAFDKLCAEVAGK